MEIIERKITVTGKNLRISLIVEWRCQRLGSLNLNSDQRNLPSLNNKEKIGWEKKNRDSGICRTLAKDPMTVSLQNGSRAERSFNETVAEESPNLAKDTNL